MPIWIWLFGALIFGTGSTYCFRRSQHAIGLCLALAVIACLMLAASIAMVPLH